MEKLPLNALRAFALVAERGGVRAAARELAISHSAVSRHLSELERWLGVALLEKRDSGGLRVTAQGQLLAEAARCKACNRPLKPCANNAHRTR